MKTPLANNFASQIYSLFVNLAIQIGTAPLLIQAWGVEAFGVWLLLTGIPSLLASSDFGFTFIAKNDMSIRVSSGDRQGAIETFQSIHVLLLMICTILLIVLSVVVFFAPLERWVNLGDQSLTTARFVLICQIMSTLLYQIFLLMNAGVRCDGRAALEALITASNRFLEFGLIAALAMTGYGLAAAAVAGLMVRAAFLAFVIFWLRSNVPWLKFGFSFVSIERLQNLIGPSISYMTIPFANSVLIHGPIILLGAVGNLEAVVMYSITRTVTRVGLSFANVFNNSLISEYSFAFGRRDRFTLQKLVKLHAGITAAMTIIFCVVAPWLLPIGISLLSRGSVEVDNIFLFVMTASVVLEILWVAAFTPVSAINLHKSIAVMFALTSLVAFGVITLILASIPLVIATSVLCVHLLMLLIIWGQVRALQRLF